MKNDGINFWQSLNDFPLSVSLGKKNPSWEISRWENNHCLRFVPYIDEGFLLRGDKRQLVYKGRKKSHRFTVLSDGAFEYDCILLREPESNVIALRMEGAEGFDFFRQPDFVPDPFFKGSYAVYKKETFAGEGTGKLCHIHRPKIIDACRQWCWGDLSVVGNELLIIVPENFLSEAVYPVVVDPVIGTTTVGSQTQWYDPDNEDYYPLYFEVSLGVNRFLIPETLNNTVTAFVYAYEPDYDGRCKPVLYSDNNNVPLQRRSMNEGSFDIAVGNGKPAGWRSVTFKPNTSIAGGSYVWFGLFCDWFAPRFDFGAKCYKDLHEGEIPETFPVWDRNVFYDFKLSMYFNYASAQNYVRTLTQGVRLADNRKLTQTFSRTMAQRLFTTDNRKHTADYKRSSTQTAKANSAVSEFETFFRKCVFMVNNNMSIGRFPLFFRNVMENVKTSIEKKENRDISRKCFDDVKVNSESKRVHNIFLKLHDNFYGLDTQAINLIILRSVNENLSLKEQFRHSGAFIRGIAECAENIAETKHEAEYYRFNVDTVRAVGNVFRGLLLFIKIITKVFIRDYLIRRFLVAREELVLKSCITREIILESRIN